MIKVHSDSLELLHAVEVDVSGDEQCWVDIVECGVREGIFNPAEAVEAWCR